MVRQRSATPLSPVQIRVAPLQNPEFSILDFFYQETLCKRTCTGFRSKGRNNFLRRKWTGDVLIAWENEAYLCVKDYPDDYEIVTPSISILAHPSVAIVDSVVDKKGTREIATEYLNYLYSDEAQRIAGDNYYRPSNEDILKEYADVFDLNVNLVTIDDFGGWEKAQETHFADGGVFDQIYEE